MNMIGELLSYTKKIDDKEILQTIYYKIFNDDLFSYSYDWIHSNDRILRKYLRHVKK